MTDSKNGASLFWWICVFILPIVGIAWFVVSFVFWGISTSGTGSLELETTKAMINRGLGILALIGFPLTIAGVIMVARKSVGLVGQSLRFGWKAAGKTVGTWIAFLAVYFLLVFGLGFLGASFVQPASQSPFVSSYVQQQASEVQPILYDDDRSDTFRYPPQAVAQQVIPYIGMQVLTQILGVLFAVGIISAGLKIVYGDGTLKFSDFFTRMRFGVLRRYILGTILYVIAMMLGFLLFIIPGIIVAVRCRYFMHSIIKDTMGPIDALKHSREITRGHFWEIFGLQILQGMIQVPGALALGIGLLWTIPTAYIADVKAYQILRGDSTTPVEKEVSRHTMSLEEAEAIIAE